MAFTPGVPALLARHPNRAAYISLAVVAVLLLWGLLALPAGVLWHPDEGAKLLQLYNLRLDWTGPQADIVYPGRDLDPTLKFVPFHPKQYHLDADGNINLQWPLFLATLTAPFYSLLGMIGLYTWPLLGALASCLLAWRLALRTGTPPHLAWLAIPLLGLATPLGFYSWLFFEHTLAAALVAASALLLLAGLGDRGQGAGGRKSALFLAASGAVLGLAIYLRSELYVLAAVMAALIIWRWQPWRRGEVRLPAPAWALGLLLVLAPLWVYYAVHGGGILPEHATWYFAGGEPVGGATGPRLPQLRYLAEVGWGVIPAFLVGPDNVGGPTVPPLLSLGLVLAALLVLVGVVARWVGYRRADRGWQRAAEWICAAGLFGLALTSLPVLFSTEDYVNLHGFLLAAPFLALAVLVARPEMDRPAADLALLGLFYVVGHLLVISALSGLGPISTYEWGQRYILPAYALIVPLVVRALPDVLAAARLRRAGAITLICAALLVMVGAGFMLRGWLVLEASKIEIAEWQQQVAENSDPALLTGDWWLPLLLAPEFNKHRWYLVAGQAGAQEWLATPAGSQFEAIASASIEGDPVGDYLPVISSSEAPGGFRLVRHAAIAR